MLTGHFVQATCTKCHREDEIPQAPVLSQGKHLLHELGCLGRHRTGKRRQTRRRWGRGWPSSAARYRGNGWIGGSSTPRTTCRKARCRSSVSCAQAADALAAYLMTFHDTTIDGLVEPKGDHDAGAAIFRQSQCITCHVTREDARGNPVGGTIGPDLRKLGNKVSKCWLIAFFKDPHAFYPHTKMPRFHFSDQEAVDLAQYAIEEWVDMDLAEAEKKEPAAPPDSREVIEQGKCRLGSLSSRPATT